MRFGLFILIFVLSVPFQSCSSRRAAPMTAWRSGQPRRVVVLVMDQFRRDFLDRFSLPNLKRLQSHGVDFVHSSVGHLTSNTVVSHPVITTGLFPKHLPWVDHLSRDVAGMLGKKGTVFSPLDISADSFRKFLAPTSSTSLLSRIAGEPNQKLVVAQKAYAAYSFAAPLDTTVLTLSSKRTDDPLKGWRGPVGNLLPSFFTEPFGGRFFLDANSTYGSERTLYPLDGQRFIPGTDPEHMGGDVWVADAAISFMKNQPNWKAVFASFGSLDKVLHMLAEHEKPTTETWADPAIRLQAILTELDKQVGRILDHLESEDLLRETVVVATSDHGGQQSSSFYGTNEPGRGMEYLQYGTGTGFNFTAYPPALAPLIKTGLVEAMTHDTILGIWTKAQDRDSLQKLVAPARKLPGALEIYIRENVSGRYYYVRVFRASDASEEELQYAKQKHQGLVDTMAGPQAPEILVLLKDGFGYGLKGDHGGAQRQVQSIPMILWAPNLKPKPVEDQSPRQAKAEVRLVDINPMISVLMSLPPAELDGSPTPIAPFLAK